METQEGAIQTLRTSNADQKVQIVAGLVDAAVKAGIKELTTAGISVGDETVAKALVANLAAEIRRTTPRAARRRLHRQAKAWLEAAAP